MSLYPEELLPENEDDGTMKESVQTLRDAVVGHRIVSATMSDKYVSRPSWNEHYQICIVLDNGTKLHLRASGVECCAWTFFSKLVLHPERVNSVITGVGTTDTYESIHIYADFNDVLDIGVLWNSGTGYYGYGFSVAVLTVDA